MKDLLGGLLKATLTKETKTEVGKVDLVLAFKLIENRIEHDLAHDGIKAQVEAFIEKLHKEHEPVCEQFNAQKDAIWKEIYEAAGIPEDEQHKNYAIDKTTGIVSRVDREIDPGLKEEMYKHFN